MHTIRHIVSLWLLALLAIGAQAQEMAVARFEQHHAISMRQYLDLAIALGYAEPLKELMREPIYKTMEELETIRQNKNR